MTTGRTPILARNMSRLAHCSARIGLFFRTRCAACVGCICLRVSSREPRISWPWSSIRSNENVGAHPNVSGSPGLGQRGIASPDLNKPHRAAPQPVALTHRDRQGRAKEGFFLFSTAHYLFPCWTMSFTSPAALMHLGSEKQLESPNHLHLEAPAVHEALCGRLGSRVAKTL